MHGGVEGELNREFGLIYDTQDNYRRSNVNTRNADLKIDDYGGHNNVQGQVVYKKHADSRTRSYSPGATSNTGASSPGSDHEHDRIMEAAKSHVKMSLTGEIDTHAKLEGLERTKQSASMNIATTGGVSPKVLFRHTEGDVPHIEFFETPIHNLGGERAHGAAK